MKYSSLKYSKFILAFQVKENIFDGKKKNAISTNGSQDK